MFKQEYLDTLSPNLEKIKFTNKKSKLALSIMNIIEQYRKDKNKKHLDKIASICTDHFKIKTTFSVVSMGVPNAFFFFDFPHTNRLNKLFILNTRSSGRGFKIKKGNMEEFIKNIGDYVTEDTGTLSNDVLKNTGLKFSINIAEELLVKTFTPGEITAIILHELGHGSTLLKRSGQMFNKLYEAQDIVKKEVSNKKTQEEILEYLKKSKKESDDVLLLDVFTLSALTVFFTVLIKYLLIILLYKAKIIAPLKLLVISNIIVAVIIFLIISRVVVRPVLKEFRIMAFGDIEKLESGEKRSEILAGQYNILYTERWADEFAVQHGLGAELSSGLSKLVGNKYIKVESNIKNLMETLKVNLFEASNGLGVVEEYDDMKKLTYEDVGKRIENNLMNMYQHFKNSDMDPKFKKLYIEDIRKTEHLLKQHKEKVKKYNNDLPKVMKMIFELKQKMDNRSGDKVILADMYALNNEMERLIKNSFYFKSDEILELLDE